MDISGALLTVFKSEELGDLSKVAGRWVTLRKSKSKKKKPASGTESGQKCGKKEKPKKSRK